MGRRSSGSLAERRSGAPASSCTRNEPNGAKANTAADVAVCAAEAAEGPGAGSVAGTDVDAGTDADADTDVTSGAWSGGGEGRGAGEAATVGAERRAIPPSVDEGDGEDEPRDGMARPEVGKSRVLG